MKFIPHMLSVRWNSFRVCMDLHVKTVHILLLAAYTRKFVPRMLSVRWNRFLVCSVCDKIISADAQHAHAIIFKIIQKSPIKMQISAIKNRNFEKPFRTPSYRTKVNFLKKKIFWISLKKIWFRVCSVTEKMFKILAKIER
jgi:hypothetical protein